MEIRGGVLDFKKICRLCLTEETFMTSIYNETDDLSDSVPLPLRIMSCVSVELSSTDGLPSQICASCLCQVDGWCKFKDLCENADSLLRKYINNEPLQVEAISQIQNMAQEIKRYSSFPQTVKEEGNAASHNQTESFGSKKKINTVENQNVEGMRQFSLSKYGTRTASSQMSQIKEEQGDNDDDDDDDVDGNDDVEENDEFSEEKVVLDQTYRFSLSSENQENRRNESELDETLDNESLANRIRAVTDSSDYDFQNDYSSDENAILSSKKRKSVSEKNKLKTKKKVHNKKDINQDIVKPARTIQTQTGNDEECTLEIVETKAANGLDDTVTSLDKKKIKSRKTQTPKEKSSPKKRFRVRPAVPSSCTLCDKVYKNSEILRQHMKSHHVTGTIECPNCKLTFTSLRSLKYHEQRKHSNLEPVPCTFCGKKFLDKKYLRIHENIHSQVNQYVCQFCGRKFIMKTNLTVHISRHHTLKTNDFICQVCGKAFPFKLYLKKHFKTHTDYKPYQCSYCEAKFRENTLLRKHINSIHLKLRPFLCQYCHKTFTRNLYLREHMESQHLGIQKKIECSRCGENFQNRNRLRQHECEGRLEVLNCYALHRKRKVEITVIRNDEDCGKNIQQNNQELCTFVSHQSLISRISGTTLEDSNVLKNCDSMRLNLEPELCTGSTNAVDEIGVNDGRNDINTVSAKPYTCECSKTYFSRYHMEIHRRFLCSKAKQCNTPLKGELNSSDDETYMKMISDSRVIYFCGCNKKFCTKKLLMKHQMLGGTEDDWMLNESTDEEGNVVYTCECKEKFNTKGKLKRHRSKGKCKEYSKCDENYEVKRDGFGRKVYICLLCNRTFCRKNYLLLHKSHSRCKSLTKRTYECSECGTTFGKKKFLTVHRKKFHIQEYKCEHCLKDFANITTLRNHKTLVHKDGFTKFTCEYCAMKFLGISALVKHIRKHTNERPYKCHLCKKAFVVERSLKTHVDFVHSGRGKNFICDICGVTFARKEYLLNHAHVHKKDRRFNCDFCEASFRWNAAKRKHLFVKHQDKLTLYKCKYCEKKFKLEKNCDSHELEHEKNFGERIQPY